jgi:UPF0271 protein
MIAMEPGEIEYLVTYQIGALQGLAESRGARVVHVKPHGALNNMAHNDPDIARAVARGIRAAGGDMIFFANCCSEMTRAGEDLGLRVAHEAYADRLYGEDGMMLPRSSPGSVIRDADQAGEHVYRMVAEQAIFTPSGRRIPTPIDTFCIHGDEPTAVAVAESVTRMLVENGIDIGPVS